jgi:hypothetical protein
MAGPPTVLMTVLHLETGHVLAAVSAGAAAPTVDELTGDEHLTVRLPDPSLQVEVGPELLTAIQVPVDDDVLDRPQYYQLVDGVPQLSLTTGPEDLTSATPLGPAGTPCLSLWQAGDELEVVREVLNASGAPPTGTTPPGGTHRLVACKGAPLVYDS